jgi:hypothetical protein
MRKIFCVGLLFAGCFHFATAQGRICKNDWANDALQGKVKSVIINEYLQPNDTSIKGDLFESSIRYYDEQGYLTEIKEFGFSREMEQRQVFLYSKKRNKCVEMLYGEDGDLLEKTTTKFNSAGYIILSILTDALGKVLQKDVYERKENNSIARYRK